MVISEYHKKEQDVVKSPLGDLGAVHMKNFAYSTGLALVVSF